MNLIIAIIRIDKMNDTKQALSDVDLPSFMAIGNVFGRGKGTYDAKVLKGVSEDRPEAISQLGPEPRLRPHRMIQLVVPKRKTELAVNTIIEANRTKTPGDGKIFVLPCIDAIRIRTGEQGDIVLD
jgi:nitrogen regulatory protein PII 2